MDTFIIIFVLVLCILIIWKYNKNSKYPVIYVKSSINDKSYLVRNLPDKQKAADILAQMNNKFTQLVEYLKSRQVFNLWQVFVLKDTSRYKNEEDIKNKTDKASFNKFAEDVKRIIKNYNPDVLSENTPDSKFTSYSENKGQKIVFCLRQKPSDKLVDLNTMTFVGLHEMSHLMTKTIGHDNEFWANFKILLRIAIRIGIYKCQDFERESKAYCGTRITDSPLRCGDV